MRSRQLRDGISGLLILGGLAGAVGLYMWLNNVKVGSQGYAFTVTFDDAGGLLPGAAVRLRGVQIGRVEAVQPGADSVLVSVSVGSTSVAIPRDATVLSNQTGLIGETALEITPLSPLITNPEDIFNPLSEDCDSSRIICSDDVIEGLLGVNYTQLVLQLDNLVSRIDNEEFFEQFDELTTSITEAAQTFASLSQSLQDDVDFASFGDAAQSINDAAQSVSAASADIQDTVNRVSATLDRLEPQMSASLSEITSFSNDISAITSSLRPILSDPSFAENLTLISDQAAIATTEAAAAAANLNTFVASISDPDTIASLRGTLDSARVTFENAEKITADLDNITGDAAFRENLRKLVEGLGDLVSQNSDTIRPVSFTPVEFTRSL